MCNIVFSINRFYVTCGRPGVGAITKVKFQAEPGDNWYVNWVEVWFGSQETRIPCLFYVTGWSDQEECQ